jgi:hypothetical protein
MTSNKRPYFTASMVEDNLRARETGVGVNQEYVIFYERRQASEKKTRHNHSLLVDGLKKLGLEGITVEQVETAMAACFPNGTSGQDETAVLRTIFRHLKRTESR